jgi:hypothetical protein
MAKGGLSWKKEPPSPPSLSLEVEGQVDKDNSIGKLIIWIIEMDCQGGGS